MYNVKGNKDPSRGGFQDRDAGRETLRKDMGPDHGPDYAQFSAPRDAAADEALRSQVEQRLRPLLRGLAIEFYARNGFIVLKGCAPDDETRRKLVLTAADVPGVIEVINQISFSH